MNALPATGYTIPYAAPWSTYAPTNYSSAFPPFVSPGYNPPSTSTFQTPVSVEAVFAHNFHALMTEIWNLAVDQKITNTMALHVAYVGNESYHLQTIIDQNPGIYSSNPSLSGVRSTYPNFGQILEDTSLGTSPYQSLQVGFEKQVSHGFEIHEAFTWSKVIDLSSTGNIALSGGLANPFNIRFNRGISSLNVPLNSATYFVYHTPALKNLNAVERGILGDWEVSAIITSHSGSPFGICGCGDGSNASGSDQYGDRADFVPGASADVKQGSKQQWLQHYLNPAAFVTNAPGTFGDTGKNIFTTPTINSTDSALMKNWTIREQYKFQFRWEMFNTFNHTSFGGPNTDPTQAAFGQITGTGSIPARVMQGALKLTF
jgi:hypothetical protein